MLTALRRGPAAAGVALRFTSVAAAKTPLSRPSWLQLYLLDRRSPITLRYLCVGSARYQGVHAAYNVEQDLVDDEVDPSRRGSQSFSDSGNGAITSFQELADRGLVKSELIQPITEGMGISTMTQVQTMTIAETLKGYDV